MDLQFFPGFSFSHRSSSGDVLGHGSDGGGKFFIEGRYTVNNPQNKFDLDFEKKKLGNTTTTRCKAEIRFNSRQMSGIYLVNGNYGGEFKLNHVMGNEKQKHSLIDINSINYSILTVVTILILFYFL